LPGEVWADQPVREHAVLSARKVLNDDVTGCRFVMRYFIGENLADKTRREKLTELLAGFGPIEKAVIRRKQRAQKLAKHMKVKA
jgi:hypothetical protein